jgi:outer membrane cobalamin receptor
MKIIDIVKRLLQNMFLFSIVLTPILSAQQRQFQNEGGIILGRVFDYATKAPIEYANIVLFTPKDSSLVTGTVSDSTGKFIINKIPPGQYYLDCRFIGFDNQRFDIVISPEKITNDLGNIFLRPSIFKLEDVVVEGDRSPVTYQIDKKVIDVNKMQTVISGNAADVLQNVPSITTDIEGNISLRGNPNFTVLIDGRPSVIGAQDALQQIPASSIEKIEIITNPSAKYDPEGASGIINILLKKNQNLGLSGIINANAGLKNKYGGDFLFEYKTTDYNLNFGMDYNRRFSPGTSSEEKRFITDNSTSYLNSTGDMEWERISFGIRGGIEFLLGEMDYINIAGRYGKREGPRNSILDYTQWSQTDPQKLFYESNNLDQRSGNHNSFNFTYLHKFNAQGHEIKSELDLGYDDGNESNITQQFSDGSQTSGKKTTEVGPSKEIEGKLEYTLPLSETSKFEAGYQGQAEITNDRNELYEYNPQTQVYEFQSLYSNSINYKNSDHAFYSIYADNYFGIGLQGGLRTEYTYRTVTSNNQVSSLNRWDLFPSFHSSYKLNEGTQIMASYTRRIQRPHGWSLEPYLTWIDANNVRQGNPSLEPEFIDSYETGIQTYIGKISISADLYYRITHNKVEQIRSVYQENVTLNSVENVGTDYSLGSEFMMIVDPFGFWNVNLMANLYDYKIEGMIYNEDFLRKSFSWNTRFNNVFRLGTSTQMQLNLNYGGPRVSSQGKYEGSFAADISVKHDLFDKKLSLILQVRDLFRTAKYESISQGPDFYTYNYMKRESPVVMLTIRIIFNNYKPKSDRDQGENPNGAGEEF